MGRSSLTSHAGVLGTQFAQELPDPFAVAVLGLVTFLVGAWWFRDVISRILFNDLARIFAHVLDRCRRRTAVDQTPLLAATESRGQGSDVSQNVEQAGPGLVSRGIVDNATSGGQQARMPLTSETTLWLTGPKFSRAQEGSLQVQCKLATYMQFVCS
jgi:hypothetical protein